MVRLFSVWMVATIATVVEAKKSSSRPHQQSLSRAAQAVNAFSDTLHSSVSRTMDRRRLAFPEAGATARSLQGTSAPANEVQCLNASTVNFDDDFSKAVYGSAYQATCTCVQEDNTLDLLVGISSIPDRNTSTPEEIAEFTSTFNELFGEIEGRYEFDCTSGCSTCFDNNTYCGFLVTYEELTFSARATDFSFDEIDAGVEALDPAKVVADTTYDSETCLVYETGETGEVCFRIDSSGPDILTSGFLPNCTITYNDEPCTSCESIASFAVDTNSTIGCFRADCTNVVPDANLDSCAKTGFVGPFRFLQGLSETKTSPVELGTCGAPPALVDSFPPMTATPLETTAPTGAFPTPVQVAVTDAPPSTTPNATTAAAGPTANTSVSTNGNSSSTNGGVAETNGCSSSSGNGWSVKMVSTLVMMVAGLV